MQARFCLNYPYPLFSFEYYRPNSGVNNTAWDDASSPTIIANDGWNVHDNGLITRVDGEPDVTGGVSLELEVVPLASGSTADTTMTAFLRIYERDIGTRIVESDPYTFNKNTDPFFITAEAAVTDCYRVEWRSAYKSGSFLNNPDITYRGQIV